MLKKIKMTAKDWVANHKKRLSEEEYLSTRLTMCKKCYTFYYEKSWHFERPLNLNEDDEKEISVRFTECPACVDQEVAMYEVESLPFPSRT